MISNSAHTVHMRFTGFWNFSKMVFGCTFWLLRNFYPGDAHHANYGGHSLNHQFQHCAHSVYQISSVFKLFEIAVCFAPFALYPISSPVIRTMLTMVNIFKSSFPTVRTLCIWDLQGFETFRNCSLVAHFGFYEISTPVMRIMLYMANIV